MLPVLGIDLAKAKYDVALQCRDGKVRHKAFRNTPEGHAQLLAWLARQAEAPVHACLEATGPYGEAVALALADAGHTVSIVNPLAIKAYGQSELSRAKTDRADAGLILRYCVAQRPPAWVPLAPEIRTLQALVRRIVALEEMREQELNRLEAYLTPDAVRQSIQDILAELTDEIARLRARIQDHIREHPGLRTQRDLLTSIPGIGKTTAETLLAELFGPLRCASVKQIVAKAGLAPRVHESGATVRGRGSLSPLGTRRLRKALYFPAIAAIRFNPVIHAMAHRLTTRGKCNMVIITAAMRRLVHLAYGVLKSNRPFDPSIALSD
jgi:transposase